jgi:soluble lytic murein transglycosylase-like protein
MTAALPPPDAPIPQSPPALVRTLALTERRLGAAVRAWKVSLPPPHDVVLLVLYEQRIVRLLAVRPGLAARVVEEVPAVADDVAAIGALLRLSRGSPSPARIRVGPPAPADRLLAWYRAAQRRFGVRWQLLAAVNYVESAFGKVRSASGAGAQGPMQFLPATWEAYGLGGDVHDPRDAILGAANYLAASGVRRDERAALFRYNHSTLYVDAILRYARAITRDPRRFLVYYSRQVYARTDAGVRRITGPR